MRIRHVCNSFDFKPRLNAFLEPDHENAYGRYLSERNRIGVVAFLHGDDGGVVVHEVAKCLPLGIGKSIGKNICSCVSSRRRVAVRQSRHRFGRLTLPGTKDIVELPGELTSSVWQVSVARLARCLHLYTSWLISDGWLVPD
jgi:hypothetical protein